MAHPQAVDNGYPHPFANGFSYLFGVGEDPRTLCELAMTRFSAELRSIKDWWILRQDNSIRNTWLETGLTSSWRVDSENTEVKLTKHQVEYVLDELSGYAALRDENTGIQVSCFDRIWETEALLSVPEEEELKAAVDKLYEHNQSSAQDRHESNILVNPFRHSFVLERSCRRSSRENAFELGDNNYSRKFAILPTDVEAPSNSAMVLYKSYINGINPALTDVYEILGVVLRRLLKLLENVLTFLHRSNPLPQRITGTYTYRVWDEPEIPDDSDDEEAWEQYQRDVRHWALHRPIEVPDVTQEGYQGQLTRILHRVSLTDRRIQVIHKIADIALNEERRETADESWHVEGMKNERIAACALFFQSVEGIEDAHLDFRMAVTMPINFRINDEGATLKTWGLRNHAPCNQFVGSVRVRSGLAIAFPNFYQSKLRDVRLSGGRKEGRLTMLAFYLVDPDIPPIISTADIAPQQRGWIFQALQESLDSRLPTEIVEKITAMVESSFSEEEANEFQRQMQAEREAFASLNSRVFFSVPFDVRLGQAY